jgi:hypothetical protein
MFAGFFLLSALGVDILFHASVSKTFKITLCNHDGRTSFEMSDQQLYKRAPEIQWSIFIVFGLFFFFLRSSVFFSTPHLTHTSWKQKLSLYLQL